MTKIVNVAEVIDTGRVGALQIRAFAALRRRAVRRRLRRARHHLRRARDQPGMAPAARRARPDVQRRAIRRDARRARCSRRSRTASAGAACSSGRASAFGVLTLSTVLAGSLDAAAILRFFTGLGLGAAIPNAIGLASEYAPKKRRASLVMFVSSGISLGAIVAGMVAARAVATGAGPTPALTWQIMFVVGGALPLLLAAALYLWLPESIRFLALLPSERGKPRRSDCCARSSRISLGTAPTSGSSRATAKAATRPSPISSRSSAARATVLIWIAFFMSLLQRLSRDQLAADVAQRVGLHAIASGRDHVDVSRRRRARHVRVRATDGSARRARDPDLRVPARGRGLLHVRDRARDAAVEHDAAADGDRLRRDRRASRHHDARVDDLSRRDALDRAWAGRSASAASARSSARRSAATCSRPASTRSTCISSASCPALIGAACIALLRWRPSAQTEPARAA